MFTAICFDELETGLVNRVRVNNKSDLSILFEEVA